MRKLRRSGRTLRYFADRYGNPHASIEGTHLPLDVLRKYARRTEAGIACDTELPLLPQAGEEEASEALEGTARKEAMRERTPRVDQAELLRRTQWTCSPV